MWRSGCTSRSFPRLLFTSSVTLILCTSRGLSSNGDRVSCTSSNLKTPTDTVGRVSWLEQPNGRVMESLLESQCIGDRAPWRRETIKFPHGGLATDSAGSKSSLNFHATGLRAQLNVKSRLSNPFDAYLRATIVKLVYFQPCILLLSLRPFCQFAFYLRLNSKEAD